MSEVLDQSVGPLKFAYAGNRQLGVDALRLLISRGHVPSMVLVGGDPALTEYQQIDGIRDLIPSDRWVNEPPNQGTTQRISALDVDYLICVHYPFVLSDGLLRAPRIGAINLHPSLLPFNRGWHTPTWSILNGTPAGATLHFMSEAIDEGEIILQRRVDIRGDDTAHSLYQRILVEELELLVDALPLLTSRNPPRRAQRLEEGSLHKKGDLEASGLTSIRGSDLIGVEDLITRLRALTTNDPAEALRVETDSGTFRVRIEIMEDNSDSDRA